MPVRIPLTQGKFTIVDNCDSHFKKYKWRYGARGYAMRSMKLESGKVACISLHSVIIGRSLKDLEIDHIDGNPLNNRRKNLRFVTHRQNSQNLKRHRNGETLGTTLLENGKWQAVIHIKKSVYLGSFKTKEEAGDAYQKALRSMEKK